MQAPPGRVTPQNDTLTPASPHCGSTVTGTGPEPFSCFERQQPRRRAGRHDTSDCRPSPGPPLRLPLLSRAGQVSTPRRPRFLCCLSCSLRKTHFEAPGACSPERDGPGARGVWEWGVGALLPGTPLHLNGSCAGNKAHGYVGLGAGNPALSKPALSFDPKLEPFKSRYIWPNRGFSVSYFSPFLM